jgi:hypothetical protein
MSLGDFIARASVFAGLAAFALAGVLSVRAQVEPLYVVLRSIGAFLGVMWLARCGGSVVEALGAQASGGDDEQAGA